MNQVSIIGRLVRDPEKFAAKEGIVAAFTLAFNERNRAVFVPVLTFGKLAEAINKYLKKGSQVAVSGKLTNRTVKFGERGTRNMLEVIAERVDFLSKPSTDSNLEQIEEDLPF